MKIRFAVLLATLSSVASAATPAPKVVFIGDYITYNWTSGFAANPNWVNQGVQGIAFGGLESSPNIAAAIKLHPAIIHILMNANIAATASPEGYPEVQNTAAQSLDTMVKQAQAADIKVILGISPDSGNGFDAIIEPLNAVVAAYGAAHNIQVVNYENALCECFAASGQPTATPNDLQQVVTLPNQYGMPVPFTGLLPTAAGYAVMTSLAETAIANEYLTLKSGYLSNVARPDDNLGLNPGMLNNLNTVPAAAVLQFTPTGVYSDGSAHPQNNTTWEGANGTWTSSDPIVMSISQQGLAYAMTPGTAAIKYTQPNGVDFHEWIMYVK